MARNVGLSDNVYKYLVDHSVREHPVLAALRAETAKLPHAGMQIGPDQGQFMALLARLIGARRCIEVGVFTGYSSLAVALALPPDGLIVACDVSEEWTAIARRYWEKAGVAGKIDLRLKPGLETLDELLKGGQQDTFDFAFVDADKPNYINYYEKLLQLVRPGGLICADNTLGLSGAPIIRQNSVHAKAMDEFNRHVHHDERVDLSMVSIGEGLSLLRRR